MIIAAAKTPSSAPRHSRPAPVRAPLDRWHSTTPFQPKAWLQDRFYFRSIRATSHSPERICSSVTWCLGETRRQTPTQIPIALKLISVTLLHPRGFLP